MTRSRLHAAPRTIAKEAFIGWLFAAPALVLMTVFILAPFLMAIGLSFTNQRLIPNPNVPTEFVGLGNYFRLFSDREFMAAIRNNLRFSLIVVPLQTCLALGLALLINSPIRGVKVFRTIYFSPVVASMVVVSIVWYLLLNPGRGFINQFLRFVSLGAIAPISWLQDPRWALPAVMMVSIWQGAGFQMIIFLAGLQEIPGELYEASRIDGAGSVLQFFRVTLPLLRNTTLFVIITTSILSFKLFQQVWVMTQGGPQNATLTTIVYLYQNGFRQLRVGFASAIGIFFFVAVLAVSLLQQRLLKKD